MKPDKVEIKQPSGRRQDDKSLEVSFAYLKGMVAVLLIILTVIAGLSGWSAVNASSASKGVAVLSETVRLTSESQKTQIASFMKISNKEILALMERVKTLEDDDKDKQERMKEVEKICFGNLWPPINDDGGADDENY